MASIPNATPVPVAERERLRELVAQIGDRAAAEQIGIGRNALARATAGFAVYKTTATAIRLALAAGLDRSTCAS